MTTTGCEDHPEDLPKDNDLVEDVYQYLTHRMYPALATNNQKRVIRNKAKKFSVRDGELYYINVKRGRGNNKVSLLYCTSYIHAAKIAIINAEISAIPQPLTNNKRDRKCTDTHVKGRVRGYRSIYLFLLNI